MIRFLNQRLFILFSLFQLIKSILNLDNQFILQQGLVQCPCSPYSDKNLVFDANDVFSQHSEVINRITITGWIYLKAYDNKQYTIISIFEDSNSLLLFNYKFSPSATFTLYLDNNPSPFTISTLQQNQWIFIKVYVTYYADPFSTSHINLVGRFHVYTATQSQFSIPELRINTNKIKFDTTKMEISIGWPNASLGLTPCCCFIKLFQLFWNRVIVDSNILRLIGDTSNGVYNKFVQVDFQNYLNNKGLIYNHIGFQDKLDLKYDHYDSSILKSKEFIRFDKINFHQTNGFTLSFFFKILEIPLNINIVTISSSQNMNLILLSSQIVVFQINTSPPINLQFGVMEIGQWIQIILILHQGFETNGVIILKQNGLSHPLTFNLLSYSFQSIIIVFGSQSTHSQFQLANIQIYEGTQVDQGQNCKYRIALSSGYQCLQCDNDYVLDYQNNHTCVYEPSLISSIPGLKDWDPQHVQCPEGMIQQNGSNECICRKQFYLKEGKCLRCPKYCNECTNEMICKFGGDGRIQGVCPISTFDDGYECLKNYSFIVPNKINKIYQIPSAIYDSTCSQSVNPALYTLENFFMNLQENDSFFFSFSMKLQTSSSMQSIIGYFENQGQIIFKILYQAGPNIEYIELYDQSSNLLSKFRCDSVAGFWIGIWTDLRKAVFSLNSNEYFYQDIVDIGSNPIYNQPKLCIGPCKIGSTPYVCFQFIDSFVLFIKNMAITYEKKQLQFISHLAQAQTTIVAYYVHTPSDPNSPIQSKNIYTNVYNFQFTGNVFHKSYYGFATHQQFVSRIFISQYSPLTFSCTIYIEQITKTVNFIETLYNQEQINYELIPHESLQSAQVQVCYGQDCQSTKKCMIDYQQFNFLMIKYSQKCLFCNLNSYEEFEIVINYCRESLFFLKKFQFPISSSNIDIGTSNNSIGEFLIYFNHLRIYTENTFFYFSYDLQDHCFIYINLLNMHCLYPKNGYYILGNDLVTRKQCNDLSIQGNQIYTPNEVSRECQNTQISSKLCIEYDLLSNLCTKCRYDFLDINTFCQQCQQGYYHNKQNGACQPCHPKCLSCVDQYDKCTACAYKNSQNPPSCECQQFQFLNNNSECVNCSSKCQSCQGNENNCIECSLKRINPPNCICDTNLYELKGQNCDNIQCASQCQTCTQNPYNCQTCKQGRINPPFCICYNGYFPISNGECSSCNPGWYYNYKTFKCEQCDKECTECIENSFKCLQCPPKMIIQDNQCYCQNGGLMAWDNDDIVCQQNMEVELKVKFENNSYYLEFIFEHNVVLQNFNNYDQDEIIQIYLHQVPTDIYQVSNFEIKDNKLSTQIKVNNSFQTVSGNAFIKKTELFTSDSKLYVLNRIYKSTPLNFKIGPLFLTQTELESKGLDQVLDSIKNSNDSLILIIQQFQIVFYFLNTIQPTAMILLLKAQLPPNLYKFLQINGIFVFPFVSDYQTYNFKTSYQLLGYELNNSEIQHSQINQLSRLGFSNSLLINIPIIIIKQLILLVLLSLTFIQKPIPKQLSLNQKTLKLRIFLINKINGENETNLLMLTLSILSQFGKFKEEKWTYRYGLYISLLEILLIVILMKFILQKIRSNDKEEMKKIEQFASRLNSNNIKFSNFYFFIQLIKKYTIIFIIFFFYNFPYFVASSVTAIFLASGIITFLQKPYLKIRTRIIKIVGEVLMSLVWIVLTVIYTVEQKLLEKVILDQDLISKYILLGRVVIILLMTFNFLYFIEFLAPIFEKLYSLFNKNKKTEQFFENQSRKKQKEII